MRFLHQLLRLIAFDNMWSTTPTIKCVQIQTMLSRGNSGKRKFSQDKGSPAAKWFTIEKLLRFYTSITSLICLTLLTRAKWNFPLNFCTMHKLSDLYSGIFQNSLTCAKWNFPLNFHTMRKLSDLYSGIFQNYWLFNHLAFNMCYSF